MKLETLGLLTLVPEPVTAPLASMIRSSAPNESELPDSVMPLAPTVPVKVSGGGAAPPNTFPCTAMVQVIFVPVASSATASVAAPLVPKVLLCQDPAQLPG